MKVVRTESGTATLNDDGTMDLNNSGYKQHLTKDQVDQAWSGKTELDPTEHELTALRDDGEDESLAYIPNFDGDYWDFGDESHVIPEKDEFS